MKATTLILAGLLGVTRVAQAALYYQGTVSGGGTAAGTLLNTVIDDGNPGGMWNTMDLSSAGLATSITDIKVTLNFSGGYNGDLYAYLSYNGSSVPLLSRVGVGTQPGTSVFGFATSGLNNVTLDSSSTDIHGVLAPTSGGTYGADGRSISPFSSAAGFDTASRLTLNGMFGGMDPNGQWTLYFADVVEGGGDATLLGWSLDITAVPEPMHIALGIFGGMLAIGGLLRRRLKQA
jgi:hypothetical protein